MTLKAFTCTSALTLALLFAVPVHAQDATVELLESQKTEYALYLRIGRTDHALQYQLDGADPTRWHSFEKDKPLSVLANRPINVWLADFNPFLQSFDSALEDFDDETFESFGQFVEALSSYGQAIGVIEVETAKAMKDAGLESKTSADTATEASRKLLTAVDVAKIEALSSMRDAELSQEKRQEKAAQIVKAATEPILNSAGLNVEQIWTTHRANEDPDEAVRLSHLILDQPDSLSVAWLRLVLDGTACLDLEEAVDFAVTLQGVEALVAQARPLEERLQDSIAPWQKKADEGYDGLFRGNDSVLAEIELQRKGLSKHADEAGTALGSARKAHDALAWDTTVSGCGHNRTASGILLGPFFGRTDGLVKKEVSMASSLEQLKQKLGEYDNDTRWAGSAFAVAEVRPAFEKGRRLTVTGKARKVTVGANGLSVEEATKGDGIFRIRHYYAWVPEVAVGAILNELETPKFKVEENDEGKLIVLDDGTEKEEIRPALMLNLLCRCWGPALVYPGFQFGVTTGEDRPGILGGLVLRFTKPRHLAISAGALYTRYKILGDLSVGDEVASKNDLEADLEFEAETVFYIGAQVAFKLGKK